MSEQTPTQDSQTIEGIIRGWVRRGMLFEPLEEAAIQQDVQAIDAYCAERERLAGIRAIDQALGKWGSYSDDTIGGERHSYKAVSVQDLERIRAELQKQSGSGEAE